MNRALTVAADSPRATLTFGAVGASEWAEARWISGLPDREHLGSAPRI